VQGVEIQKMYGRDGREIMVGLIRSKELGALIKIGPAGQLPNNSEKIITKLNLEGISRDQALEMIAESNLPVLFKDKEQKRPADLDAVVDALCRLGRLANDFPLIEEIEVNPLIVFDKGKGCLAVDIKIILSFEAT